MSLKNLGELFSEKKSLISADIYTEKTVPDEFLREYSKDKKGWKQGKFISSYLNDDGQIRLLPHQYFSLASICVPYLEALLEYKNNFNEIFTDLKNTEELKKFTQKLRDNDIQLSQSQIHAIQHHFGNQKESDMFQKFLTDYEWWKGEKGIGRSDFWQTSIANLSNLVHADSATFILLCLELKNRTDLMDYLLFRTRYIFEGDSKKISYQVLKKISETIGFSEIKKHLQSTTENKYSIPDYNLSSLFLKTSVAEKVNELTESGNREWITEPFEIEDSNYWYFSTRWNGDGTDSLNMSKLESFINKEFVHIFALNKIHNNHYELIHFKRNPLEGSNMGRNVIVYGAPGTGKSYSLREYPNQIRTVFHSDYQNSDFVGSYRPMKKNGEITYEFVPGPFINAFVTALKNPDKKISLIIEEINRGNCASIFGEIFQLLDRNEFGESVYDINPEESLKTYLEETLGSINSGRLKRGEEFFLFLPTNLSIYATMNSADQGVSPVDSAFKRRWEFEYSKISFENPENKYVEDHLFTYENISLSYRNLAESINDILSANDIPEDRHIGQFFLNRFELKDEVTSKNSISKKLFLYLWDDVLRHSDRTLIFSNDMKTYSQLIDSFMGNKKVFSQKLEDILRKKSETRDQ